MRKIALIPVLILTGGFFSGCSVTKAWVEDHVAVAFDAGKEYAKKIADDAVKKLEEKRIEKREEEKGKIDEFLSKVEPDLSFDSNGDGAITTDDFDADQDGEISFSESIAVSRYYISQSPKEGEEKNTKGLLAALGILVLLGGGAKLKKKYDEKRKASSQPA